MSAPNTKISTKIWRPLLDKFNKKMHKACLRRDAYLNKVLEVELPYLGEVNEKNSDDAKHFIAERLYRLDPWLVSLSLEAALVKQLDEICKDKGVLRDAFFNRLFLLLAASPEVIDTLFILEEEWRVEVWSESRNHGPFFQNVFHPLEQKIDPFWTLREGLVVYHDDENLVYTQVFDDKRSNADLYGLNCFLGNTKIPDHPDERTLDDILLI